MQFRVPEAQDSLEKFPEIEDASKFHDSLKRSKDIIKSGGFGTVVRTENPREVLKFIKDRNDYLRNVSEGVCRPLDQEFAFADRAYTILKDFPVTSVRVNELDMRRLQFAMQSINGLDLQQIMDNPFAKDKFQNFDSINRTLWRAECKRSLKALHDAGIIHGDIAPKNFMLTYDMKLYFIDYGLARDVSKMDMWRADDYKEVDMEDLDKALNEFFYYL